MDNSNVSLQELITHLPRITSSPQKDDLLLLAQKINATNPNIIKYFEEELLDALIAAFFDKKNVKPGTIARILHCLSAIIKKCKIDKVQKFLSLYTVMCIPIFSKSKCALESDLPEELKYEVMVGLRACVESLTEEAVVDVFSGSDENVSKVISQGLLLAAQIAKGDKTKHLRVEALNLIMSMAQHDTTNLELSHNVANMFTQFLPGLISNLTAIITTDAITPQKVIVMSLRCWGHILCMTLEDFPDKDSPQSNTDLFNSWLNKSHSSAVDEPSEWLKVLQNSKRSREWAYAAAGYLQMPISRVASKCTHREQAVRYEMVDVFANLLRKCADNLGFRASPLLDALVILSQDEDETIKNKADSFLASLSTDNSIIQRLAQNRLPEVIDQLNKCINVDDSEAIDKTLLLLHGYLYIFRDSKNGPCVIVNPLLLKKLLAALKSASRVCFSEELLHQHELEPTDFTRYSTTWKDKLVRGKVGSSQIERISHYVAGYGFDAAISILTDDVHQDENISLESIAVLNMVVKHCKCIPPFIVNKLLQLYINTNGGSVCSDPSPKELQKAVVKVVYAMEGFESLANALQLDFSKYLLQALYPVVSRIGSRFSVIRAAALNAAEVIARVTETGDVMCLIESNVDYLTHRIVQGLRLNAEEDVLDAVRIVTRLCPVKALPQLQFIVSQTLSSSSTDYCSPHVGPYLRIFHAFVQCAAAVRPTHTDYSLPEGQKSAGASFIEYIAKRREEELDIEDKESDNEEDNSDVNVEENKKIVPKHIDICVKAVTRCLHYLPMCTDMQKVLCLEILEVGLRVVSSEEDLFLPLVHQVWSPLMRRFHPSVKPLVISRSFSLLMTLCHLSKQFIRHRTLKEVLPGLRDYLNQSAKISAKQSATSAFKTTQGYKLQLQLLNGLADLVIYLGLQERDTNVIVEAAIPYLNQYQPATLQECAVKMYQKLLLHDPCFIFYRLHALSDKTEYSSNVNCIFDKRPNF